MKLFNTVIAPLLLAVTLVGAGIAISTPTVFHVSPKTASTEVNPKRESLKDLGRTLNTQLSKRLETATKTSVVYLPTPSADIGILITTVGDKIFTAVCIMDQGQWQLLDAQEAELLK